MRANFVSGTRRETDRFPFYSRHLPFVCGIICCAIRKRRVARDKVREICLLHYFPLCRGINISFTGGRRIRLQFTDIGI